MRKSKLLSALFPPLRQELLAALLMKPDRWWFMSDLARHLRVRPSTLQRELSRLHEAGVLRRRIEGRRVYYQPDPGCPILIDLRRIVIKTRGLADVLRQALEPMADRIDWAFVYGSVARSEETSGSDVDLMIVGDIGLAEIAAPLRKIEKRIDRPVNPTLYGKNEFERKLRARQHFLTSVLDQPRITIMGHEDELATTTGQQQNTAA